jgi:hypothetical protein
MRGEIFEQGFEPQFSGHETFPLRYSWLKKAFDAVHARETDRDNRTIFSGDDAISNFGVGKNMVTSMRYWSVAARVIEDTSDSNKGPYGLTSLGRYLFGEEGLDPYIENPATLWLIHWQLAANPKPTTTVHFVFNHFHTASFYRQQLIDSIQRYCDSIKYSTKISSHTLKRDVECFLRTYATKAVNGEEDSLDSLLSELSLIRVIGKQDGFALDRGHKPSLPDAIFLYGLISFALSRRGNRVFSLESLLHEPGSPGRIFLLDEEALLERLGAIEHASGEKISWSETAGLRQIIFHDDPGQFDLMKVAAAAYKRRGRSATHRLGGQ